MGGLKKIENLDYKFKWTNDIYIQDKKICGILVEKIRDFFIIGIGVNVNNDDFGYAQDKATSLKNITGKFYSTEDIIFCIINEFKKYFSENWEYVLKEINSYNYLKGKEIEIIKTKCQYLFSALLIKYGESLGSGIAKDIVYDGRLKVEIDGEEKLFNIGEIHIKNRR